MKTLILIFIFATGMMVMPLSISASCSSQHSCNGCNINFVQADGGWAYSLSCNGEDPTIYSGPGDYQGTVCGGEEPCNVPQTYPE